MLLSGVVVARDRADFLPRILPALGEISDEVIVLVDDRTSDNTAAVAREFTPNVFEFTFDPHFQNMEIAVLERAKGDWILRVDHDETLGEPWTRSAVEALMRDRDVTHYLMPIRWIVPPGDRYLSNAPWFPNYGPRMYRNVRSLIYLGSSPHDVLNIAGEGARVVDLFVRHWNHVLKTRAEREEAVARYAVIDPDFPCREYYLFEDYYYETAPDADLEPVRLIPAAAPIDVQPARVPKELVAGDTHFVEVLITNDTQEQLRAASKFIYPSNLYLASKWFPARGGPELAFAQRQIPLPASVKPRSSMAALVPITAPPDEGEYFVRFELLRQGIEWFAERYPGHGSIGALVRVRPASADVARRIEERDAGSKQSSKSSLYEDLNSLNALIETRDALRISQEALEKARLSLDEKEAEIQKLAAAAADLRRIVEEKEGQIHRQHAALTRLRSS